MPRAKSIYIFGEPQSGKSIVLLGIMELLSRHVQRLGFFRPLVREDETKDDAIRLISSHYHLPFRSIFFITFLTISIPPIQGEPLSSNFAISRIFWA